MGAISLQENAFIGRFSSHKSLDCARRKFEAFIIFFTGLQKDPFDLTEWDVAAWVADQASKGASGPRRSLQALAWAEKAYGVDLGISASLVQAQRASTPSTSAPKPARMATIKMLGDMEKCVAFAPSNVLRCWAGAFAALGHGVLRWSDLQHSEGVKLTEDAVFGVTWRMKGKHVKTPWAALRRGFLNKDWGSSWLAELAKNELPGKDFVLRAPNSTWTGFQGRIADFHDAQAALRALLVLTGLSLQEAMSFSCHSWRHLYPTAGKQLDLSPDSIDSMGRWQSGCGMAELYDSRACVSELLQKVKVTSAVSAGWNLVDPGCVPRSAPSFSSQAVARADPQPVRQRARAARRAQKLPAEPVAFVLHTGKARLHGYACGLYPVCRQWRCGDVDSPVPEALFVDSAAASLLEFEVCRSCAKQHKCSFPKPSSEAVASVQAKATVEENEAASSMGASSSSSSASS